MDPQLQLEESLLRPVEEEEQEVGLERKKHVRPTKNNVHTLDSTVSDEHYHAEIITSSSNISSITTNDEFVHEENNELLLNNGGYANDNGVYHAEEATAVVEEIWEEEPKRFHFEDESGTISTVEHQTTEYSNGVDVFLSKTRRNLVQEVYDLTAEKSDAANGSAEHLVSEKDRLDGERAFNITVPSQEALSHHHHHHHHHYHEEGHTEFIDQVGVQERVKSDVIEEIDFEEIDVEETDYNVEEVIEKQNTHDLVCPHCSSCITRSVILRRRPKLRKRIKATRRPKTTVTPIAEVTAPVAPTPEPTPNPDIHSGDPEAFRCLSCFSLIIRIGTSIFSRTKTEEMRTSQQITTSETTSIVTGQGTSVTEVMGSTSVTVTVGQTGTLIDHSKENIAEAGAAAAAEPPNFILNPILPGNGLESGETKVAWGKKTEYTNGNGNGTSVTEVTGSTSVTVTVGQIGTLIDHSKEKIAEAGAAAEPSHFILNSILPGNGFESGETKVDWSKETEYTNGNGNESRALSWQQLQSSLSQRQNFINTLRPSKQIEADEVKIDIEKKPEDTVEKEKEDDILVVAPTTVGQVTDEEQQPLLVQEPSNDLDVLKSIVYGGLVESITSLGVVSSAVGAGASTLNIFVLAMANLIGGLFILAHNLKELRKESDETTTQTDTEDNRYFKLLGRRGRFPIHATIVVISYIVFGLVAPITYGFSFHVSNDRDYKLASVAAASLFCVFLLSLAKAHVKNPPRSYGSYIKTVLEYLSLGAAASGISFLAGQLLDKIMEQLGWLGSTTSLAATLMPGGSGWTSY